MTGDVVLLLDRYRDSRERAVVARAARIEGVGFSKRGFGSHHRERTNLVVASGDPF